MVVIRGAGNANSLETRDIIVGVCIRRLVVLYSLVLFRLSVLSQWYCYRARIRSWVRALVVSNQRLCN
jgi:ribosomal protein L19